MIQCEVAARDAHATVTQLQPERRDALLDSKLRHEYNFESDLVKDCSVEEHRALDSEIQVSLCLGTCKTCSNHHC